MRAPHVPMESAGMVPVEALHLLSAAGPEPEIEEVKAEWFQAACLPAQPPHQLDGKHEGTCF